MDLVKTPFLPTFSPSSQNPFHLSSNSSRHTKPTKTSIQSQSSDPWTLSDGNGRPIKPFRRKKPLSDDNARRIIKAKAQYLSRLRRNQGSHAQTPKWIQRTPEQMDQWLKDDRDGHLYGKHVVAAIKLVRNLSTKAEGSYNMREVMSSFVTKLTFREMCIVLKEQKGWRQVRDFFAWMKLQLCYRPSVIAYTIVLRMYGQVGKINLAEQTFLEMLEAGCEPDEVACGTMLCTYARWGRHKEMMAFYSAVHRQDIVPSVAVFNFMISSLQKKALHGKVIQLWKQMIDAGVQPNHFSYTIVISSYAKEGFMDEAFDTFDGMKKSGFVPEEVTYSHLISLTVKLGSADEALKLYEDMKSRGIIPSNYTCASLLSLHYKHGDFSRALGLFSEMEKNHIAADEVIYGILIRIYGKLGLYEDAEKTFAEIEHLGLLRDERTFVAMAHVYLSAGNYEKALGVLELMKSRNIEFSRFAYSALLQCYATKSDAGLAEVAFQALYKTGAPNVASYDNMLNLYVKLGLLEKAKAFIVQMKKDGVQFDEDLNRTVMKVYCKEGMISDAEQLLQEMKSVGLDMDKSVQTLMMDMYGKFGGIQKAENMFMSLKEPGTVALSQMLCLYLANDDLINANRILRSMLQSTGGLSVASQLIRKFVREVKNREEVSIFYARIDDALGNISRAEVIYDQIILLGCRPEDAAIASLISSHGKRQQLRQAKEVFAIVCDSHPIGRPVYCSMIDAYARCGNLEEAYHLYKEMAEQGHNQDAVTISVIVNVLTNYGKYQEAEDIIRNSFETGVELDTVAYNTYIKSMLETGKLHFAASIYSRMVSSNVVPSIQTYSTMISVYGRGGKLDKAIEMFDMACNLGVPIDEKAYTNMILYYGKAGKVQDASLLFCKMQEEGIRPGKISYNTMINVYATAGLHLEAEKLFQDMQRDGCSPDSFTYLALVQAYTKAQKYSEAEEVLHAMKNQGISPTCAHFNHLLSAFALVGLVGDAERVYREIEHAGLSPDLASHRAILRGYMDYGHVHDGISFFEEINGCVKPDKFILSAAVHLYESVGQESAAGDVLASMNRHGILFLKNLKVGSKAKRT